MRAFRVQQPVFKPLERHQKRLQPELLLHRPSRIGGVDSGGTRYHESVSCVTAHV